MRPTYDHTRPAAKLGMAMQAVAINLPTLVFVVFHRDFGASTAALGTLSLASKAFPRGGTALFGLLALGGDVGCALGPEA